MIESVNQPILSLCIPIYNRENFLDKMLARFLEDKDLFENKIALYISDNCSQDNLGACCAVYQKQGLNISYHRNKENIGPDANFEQCFRHATGKYVWLLGSDDIPVRGFLRSLLSYLEGSDDYGLVHLSMQKKEKAFTCYHSSDEMAVAVNYWITFMSANIIYTASYEGLDLSAYRSSNMIQVPVYLNACLSHQQNAILYSEDLFEKETDNANNGGYNFFRVFVTNLFSIYQSFVNKGSLSASAFESIKKIEYKTLLTPYIVFLLLFKRNRNFDTTNSWKILYHHYGRYLYAYVTPITYIASILFKKLLPSGKSK